MSEDFEYFRKNTGVGLGVMIWVYELVHFGINAERLLGGV